MGLADTGMILSKKGLRWISSSILLFVPVEREILLDGVGVIEVGLTCAFFNVADAPFPTPFTLLLL